MTDLSWLDAIEARLAAATPGPWVSKNNENEDGDWQDADLMFTSPRWPDIPQVLGYVDLREEDAEFIANAPADIARLVKALRDAQAKIARVEAVRTRLLDPRQFATEGPLIGRLLVDHWLGAALAEEDS